MTTFTNTQLSTIEQTGFIGNIDGNDVFATTPDNSGASEIILHKGGEVHKGLVVTTQYPHAYALFLIKGYNVAVTARPEQVAKKDRKPLTTTTRKDVEEAMSRFNLGMQKPVEPGDSTMESQANFTDIEDVINTLDVGYRLSSYLKLRGHISYKAAKLGGQFLAKQAKALMDHNGETGIDAFNSAMGYLRGQQTEDILTEEMGLEKGEEMFETLHSLVWYANKLNFDMQELVDPTGKKRADKTFKFTGVYFNEGQRKESWKSSINLVAEGIKENNALEGTYAEYVESVDNPDWTLTEAEWKEQQTNDSTLFEKYADNIHSLLMDFGTDECYFDRLPLRTQIAAIENIRAKVPDILTKALKSVKFNRDVTNKVAESSKVKGIINGFNTQFCAMLSASKFANMTEFMYNFMPAQSDADSAPVTRTMNARNEHIAEKTSKNMKTDVHEAHDLFDMESDIV